MLLSDAGPGGKEWVVTTADARVSVYGGMVLFVGLLLGVYSWAAVGGHVPAAPWSPVGQVERHHPTPSPAPANDGLEDL